LLTGDIKMGLYVEVIKSGNAENYVYYTYQFYVAGEKYESASGKTRYRQKMVSGKLKVDIRSGDIHAIELAEGDSGAHAKYASSGLIRHWVKGELPDKACWAS
jgi:hypothetical protein